MNNDNINNNLLNNIDMEDFYTKEELELMDKYYDAYQQYAAECMADEFDNKN